MFVCDCATIPVRVANDVLLWWCLFTVGLCTPALASGKEKTHGNLTLGSLCTRHGIHHTAVLRTQVQDIRRLVEVVDGGNAGPSSLAM